jgi:hypothetical protein
MEGEKILRKKSKELTMEKKTRNARQKEKIDQNNKR